MEWMTAVASTAGSAPVGAAASIATAEMLAEEGWRLTLPARDPDRLAAAAGALEARGAQVRAHGANLADPAAGTEAVDTPGTAWADPAVRDTMLPASDLAEAVRFLIRTSALLCAGVDADHRRPRRPALPHRLGDTAAT